tara:strand:+ start:1038 stop:1853 length:816 start_codon:yes stop_codon:yes gene_type:complete
MNNKTKNITLLIAIALTVLSFQVKAQSLTTYGCLDSDAMNYNPSVSIGDGSCVYDYASSNQAHGFNSTALVQIVSPTASLFVFNKLVIKYRVSGTSQWTKIVFPVTVLPLDSTYGGFIDTLGVSMWYFMPRIPNTLGDYVSDGYRNQFTVRLNNLLPLTQYDTKIFLKGSGYANGSVANKTNKLNNTITTWNNSMEAPFPSIFMSQIGMFSNPNNQARLSQEWEHTEENIEIMNREIVSVHNLNGQVVGLDAKGIVIYTFANGVTRKVLKR